MNPLALARNLLSMRERSSAGSNATPWRLVLQGLPRYVMRDGFALKPLSLFLIVNSRCNLRCKMCDVGQGVTESMFYRNMVSGGDMPFDSFAGLVEEAASFRPFLSLTSTEPLLHPQIDDMVALVKGLGLEMNITTNGFLLPRHAEALARLGLDKITISLDGPAAVHDEIRGVRGAYAKALEGIEALHEWKLRLKRERPLILVNTTVCELNAPHLEDLFRGLPLDKIRRVGVMPMVYLTQEIAAQHNRDFGQDYPATATCLAGGLDPARIDPLGLYESARRLDQTYGNQFHAYFKIDPDYLQDYLRNPSKFLSSRNCLFPWFSAQINTRGDLLGLTRCYAATFGNVFADSFARAWNGPAMRRFRRDLQRRGSFPACSRCEGVLAH